MSETSQLALTINQPWASLIAVGLKDVENRTWLPQPENVGKRIIIHAGRNYDHLGAFMLMNDHGIVCHASNFPRGAIVGTAVLNQVVEDSTSKWFRGPYGWMLTDAKLLQPIPCTGNRKLWTVSDAVWERVLTAENSPLNPASFLHHESVCKADGGLTI
jgi:ASCH domain